VGVNLNAGGYLNNTGGLIQAGYRGVYSRSGAGTIINSGTIAETATNPGSAFPHIGVAFEGINSSYSTLVNAGTIIGSSGAAVYFGGTGNLVVVDPGAVFAGTVNGGAGGDTLELASTASVGTVAGLGTQYLGFSLVKVDAGASWALSGTNTIGSGVTLDNFGTLSGAVTLAGGGYLHNETGGTIANAAGVYAVSLAAGSVGNTGLIQAAGGVSVTSAQGTVTNSGTIIGTHSFGVKLSMGGTLSNSGAIRGQNALPTPWRLYMAGLSPTAGPDTSAAAAPTSPAAPPSRMPASSSPAPWRASGSVRTPRSSTRGRSAGVRALSCFTAQAAISWCSKTATSWSAGC
jgi:hypothetical protein